ncbi:hypothetical protein SELMODRAFT_439299 [Selaginella moellendorffii]|uniref:Phosphoglycerate mutase-like protein n=2 Tax=Selaginella moellendorffii TaxID=88036 RepID=D8R3F0_SELML|nr:hypothetical protein SELMODRAFT_439299 [Selaginella moellendorffii]
MDDDKKILHLVRHAQGHHNVGYAGTVFSLALRMVVPRWQLLEGWNCFGIEDASLTTTGWKQVKELRERKVHGGVDLVVVSPMTRTLQTAAGVFGGGERKPGEELPPLMADGVGACPAAAVSSVGCPPFIALELCREHTSVYPCDKRSSISRCKQRFPAVDFSQIMDEEDSLWSPTLPESKASLDARRRALLQWLAARKEKKIAVVSHSFFLSRLVGAQDGDGEPKLECRKRSSFSNTELRTVVLHYKH